MTVTAVPSRRRRSIAGLADQGVNSLTNFATAFVAGRVFAPGVAGSLVLALTVGYVALGLARAMVGDPMLAHVSSLDGDRRRRMVLHACTTSTALGAVMAVLGVLAWASGWQGAADMIWIAPWLPAVLIQDVGRYDFLGQQRPDLALVLDGVWAVVQGVAVVVLLLLDRVSPGALAASWGLGAAAGGLVYLVMSRTNPFAGSVRRWFGEVAHLSTWFTGSAVLAQTQYQLVLIIVAGLLTKAATGGLRIVQLVFLQPVQTFLLAVLSLIVPWASRRAAAEEWDRLNTMILRLVGLGVLSIVPFGILILARGPIVGALFPRFTGFDDLVAPIALTSWLYAVQLPLTAALRGMQRARELFVVQIMFTLATLAGCVIGSFAGGAVGVAWGLLVAAVCQLGAMSLSYARALRMLRSGGRGSLRTA